MADQTFDRRQLIDIMKFSIENSKGKIKLPLALWGVHGIGKTSIVGQVAEDMGYNLVVLHLATQDVADLIGIPRDMEIKNEAGEVVDKMTIWSCPDWLKKMNDSYKATGKPNLVFLDEANRANRMVLAAMLPFLIGGVLHTHSIGPEDAVIAAMNPATDDYEVNELIDKALLDRLGHIILKPTHKEYLNYLKQTGMDKITLSVIGDDPQWTKISDFDLGFDVTPSRRKIDYVMRVIGKKSKSWVKKHGSHIMEAYLGPAFRDAWLEKFAQGGQSITIEMLQEYDEYAEEITELLKTTIREGDEDVVTVRNDVMQKAMELVEQYISDTKESLTVCDAEWMMKFLGNEFIDDEYAASIFQANPHMKAKIASDPEFNLAVGSFLREKEIWTDEGVASWD